MTEPERRPLPPLTLNDRCDWTHCGAPALLRIVTATGNLYACAHHYGKNIEKLLAVAQFVQDERITPRKDTEGMEEPGRMQSRRGLTHADPCRWCTRRLVSRRLAPLGINGVWREYFVCPHCDETAAPPMTPPGVMPAAA